MNKILLWSIIGLAGLIIIILIVAGSVTDSLSMNYDIAADCEMSEKVAYSNNTIEPSKYDYDESVGLMDSPYEESDEEPMMDSDVKSNADPDISDEDNTQTNKIQRKIVYTADYTMHVKDLTVGIETTKSLLSDYNGYVTLQTNTRLVLRVKAEYFKDFLNAFDKVGKIISKNIRAQEVTDQFYDLQRRIEILEQSIKDWEAKRALAKTDSAMIEIDKIIDKKVEELEMYKGKMRLLADKISFSTVTIDFTTDPTPLPQAPRHRMNVPFRWMRDLRAENLLGDQTYVEMDEE